MNQLEFLKKMWDGGQLAHAYIFSGADMVGLKKAANELLGHAGCKFPDVITLSSAQSDSSIKNEKDMMEIDIDQIRRVQQFLSYKSYNGGLKAVVVEHAERMNVEAQNCFLKNLEEPKGQTLIMLLCDKPEYLLPTIASRCQTIRFSAKSEAQEAVLPQVLQNVINGDLAEKFKFAKTANLEGENFENMLAGLQRHFRNLLLDKIQGETNLPASPAGGRITSEYTNEKMVSVLRQIETLQHQAATTNLNNKLALEILLLEL